MDGHTPVRTWVPQIGLGVLLKGKGPGVEKGEVGGGRWEVDLGGVRGKNGE